jgi:hypothetical protein
VACLRDVCWNPLEVCLGAVNLKITLRRNLNGGNLGLFKLFGLVAVNIKDTIGG